MEKEGKIEKMEPKYQFGLLSEKDRVRFRDEYTAISGMPYSTFYQKLTRNGFRPLELRYFNEIIQSYFNNNS